MFQTWMDSSPQLPDKLKLISPVSKNLSILKSSNNCGPFCKAIRTYLKSHPLGTATLEDFVKALDSEDSTHTLPSSMTNWLSVSGYPVLYHNGSTLIQEPFSMWKEETNDTKVKLWDIPFSYRCINTKSLKYKAQNDGRVFKLIVNGGNESKFGSSGGKMNQCDDVMLANPDRVGYYRYIPSVQDLEILGQLLKKKENIETSILSPNDRAGLVSDLVTFTLSNRLNFTLAIKVLAYLVNERHPTVWRVAVSELDRLDVVLQVHEKYPSWRSFLTSIVFPVADDVGWYWEFGYNETFKAANTIYPIRTPAYIMPPSRQPYPPYSSFQWRQLRTIILPLASKLSHQPTIQFSTLTFNLLKNVSLAESEIHRNLSEYYKKDKTILQTVYDTAVRSNPFPSVDVLLDDSVNLPGDRTAPLASSTKPSHLARLLTPRKDGGGYGSWISNIGLVASHGGALGVQMAWEALRRSDQGGSWEWVQKKGNGLKSVSKVIEDVVGRCVWKGVVWRDAVSIVGDDWKNSEGWGSGVHIAIKRGLERAEAGGFFLSKGT
jgi:hypothetical protein